MKKLSEEEGISAQALAFTILTASRTNETLGATWAEITIATATWTIPSARMKNGKEHRVPLSRQAIAILASLPQGKPQSYVFPGALMAKGYQI